MQINKQDNIIGIGGLLGHDANVALFQKGELILAAQEERYTRIKHDSIFPHHAINDCLKRGNITADQVHVVVLAEKPLQTYVNNQIKRLPNRLLNGLSNNAWVKKLTLSFFEKDIKLLFPNAQVKYSWHHLSHAVSSYYSSGFEQTAFLCIDGKGEFANASIGFIDKTSATMTHELQYSNGLGMLYTLVTHFLGFPSFGSEYKIMGLAPYGKPVYVDKLRTLYQDDGHGAIRLHKDSDFHPQSLAKLLPWVSGVLGVKPRNATDELTEVHTNIAASLQVVFEDTVIKMAAFARSTFNTDNLLFCGGCAQNCVAAGKLRDSKIFNKTYNSPVGGDMGSGLGAALAYLQQSGNIGSTFDFKGYYLGSLPGAVTTPDAEEHIVNFAPNTLINFMAEELAKGKIIGWVHSGMELGARALGARSIIASPLVPNIQTDLNLKIKFRESFRPFAPAILAEDVNDWFEIDQPSDYMQYTAYLNKELRYEMDGEGRSFKEILNYPRCKIPSVVHVDYSARLQTVNAQQHPEFHKLLSAFKQITGVPILINTSFNVNGQPIVRTANEAWECFINTDIDLLVVEQTVYRNPFKKTTDEKLQWLKQFESYSR